MMWNYRDTERNSTETKGVNVEILIAVQGKQLEKTPSPPHSDASLPHADSHFLNPPSSANPRSFYPCSDRHVIVSSFKKLGRPRQRTKPKATQTTTRCSNSISNLHSTTVCLHSTKLLFLFPFSCLIWHFIERHG